jgi:hypothetical protein
MTEPCPCGSPDTRLYAEGYLCPAHTPSARAGNPEPDSARYCAPLRCYCGSDACPSRESFARPLEPVTANVADFRAVASGKRRSSLEQYRSAQLNQGGAA